MGTLRRVFGIWVALATVRSGDYVSWTYSRRLGPLSDVAAAVWRLWRKHL